MENNRRLWGRVRVMVRFLLFFSKLAPTDMLHTLLGRKKFEEAISDEHPQKELILLRWYSERKKRESNICQSKYQCTVKNVSFKKN